MSKWQNLELAFFDGVGKYNSFGVHFEDDYVFDYKQDPYTYRCKNLWRSKKGKK